jgi:hypothetical protein
MIFEASDQGLRYFYDGFQKLRYPGTRTFFLYIAYSFPKKLFCCHFFNVNFLACRQDTFRALYMQSEKRAVIIFASNCPFLIFVTVY